MILLKDVTYMLVINPYVQCASQASNMLYLKYSNISVLYIRGRFREGDKGASTPSKIYYLYVSATINSMKITYTFNDV